MAYRARSSPRRTAISVVLAFAVLTSASACDPRAAGDAAGDGPRTFGAADVHVLGTSESLQYVVDLDVLPDGRVWVLNSIDPYFVGFAPDGTLLGEHGAAGGGPEELGRPVGLVAGGIESEAWALDVGRSELVRASRPEAAWSTVPLSADSLPPNSLLGGRDVGFVRVRTARLGEEVVVPRARAADGSGWLAMWAGIWGADLMAVDPRDGSARRILGILDELGDPRPHAPALPAMLPFPPWFRLWTVCGDEIRVHDRLGNQIRGFAATGAELDAIPLPASAFRSVSEEAFAMAMLEVGAMEAAGSIGLVPPRVDTAQVLASLRPRIEGSGEELAALLPRYVELHCATDGSLWIRPLDLDAGGLRGGPGWLRVAREGETRTVVFPERFDPMRFSASRIWGVQRSELDVASIAWIDW